MHIKRKTYLTVAAVFAFMFLLLLSFIPGGKASAATANYNKTVPCTGGTISYYVSQATGVTCKEVAITVTCSNPGSYNITIPPNTNTTSRNLTLYFTKNNGKTTLVTLNVPQAGAAFKTITAGCTGGNYSHGIPGAYSISSTNTAICSSLASNKNYLVVKPNTSRYSRSCTVTVKNSAGRIIGYVKITQSAVPVKNIKAGYTGGEYAHNVSNAYSYVYSNTAVCSSVKNGKCVVNPSTSTDSRKCTVTVKNSSGKVITYVDINQSAVPVVKRTVSGGNTSFPYGKSGAASFVRSDSKMITGFTASNPGSFTISVSANPSSTASRSSTIIVKNSAGVYLEIIKVTQEKYTPPTLKYTYSSDPRTLTYTCANADYSKTVISNTNVCTGSAVSGKYQLKLKQNPNSTSRKCIITFKDKYGTVLQKREITQNGVPKIERTVSGGNTSFPYGKSGAASFVRSDSKMITGFTASNPGSFTISVSANPSSTASRSSTIIVKNSAGVYLEIIKVTQEKYTPSTLKYTYSSDPRTLTYTCADADSSKTVVSNTSMLSCTSISSGKFQIKLKQNPNSTSRTCTITFKDKFGTVLQKRVITQNGVPVKYATVSGNRSAKLSYGNSKASKFSYSSTYVSKITASNPGSFTIYFYANPSTTKTRSFDIIAKDSKGVYVEIIRVTQQKFTPLTISKSVDSKRNTFTYTNSDAAKFTYSTSSMFGSYKSLGSGKYQFVVNANILTSSRTGTILVYNKKGTVIEKISVKQSAVVTYTVGSGTGENITYTNTNAATFELPCNIKSVRKVSTGKYAFTQTVNLSKEKLTGFIDVLDKNGNVIQYLRVISNPTIMNIKGDFGESIPYKGGTYEVAFETSNPVIITLTNAKFSNGETQKIINKNSVKANAYSTTKCTITVDPTVEGRQVKIDVTNRVSKETKILTQLERQIGFKAATAEYPLGSLIGKDDYVYKIVDSVSSNWTLVDSIQSSQYGFDWLSALSSELNDEFMTPFDFIVTNQNIIYDNMESYFIYMRFYKDSNGNRYVILTGNDDNTIRTFMNIPDEGRLIDDNKNGVRYTGCIDKQHSQDENWIFWIDENGNLKMNLRKFGNDCWMVNGNKLFYTMGYKSPSTGGVTISNAYSVASMPYDGPIEFNNLFDNIIYSLTMQSKVF